jgi:hypothetical protein
VARFNRWKIEPLSDVTAVRGMRIGVAELGGVEKVVKVPELRAVVIGPVAKEKKKPDTPENATMVTKSRRRVRPSEGLAGAI